MFTTISSFCNEGKESHSIASNLEGTLLISRSPFPYFMLVAFEGGGPIRALILLLTSPLLWLLDIMNLESISLQVMIFIAMAGLKVADVKAVAKAVLPRFYLGDLRASAFKVFSGGGRHGKKYVVSSSPRMMVEAFLREYLGVDCVVGTELRTLGGYCTGLVAPSGLMLGLSELEALAVAMGDDANYINVGLSDTYNDHSFMSVCQERYIVPLEDDPLPVQRKDYPKPLIFHDGRLVARPAPLDCLSLLLWLPIASLLAISRLLVGKLLPYKLGPMTAAATGIKIRAKFHAKHPYRKCESRDPPNPCNKKPCTLYVCSHRTLIDPVMVATVLQRSVTAVTYSVSYVSELLSPIRTVRLRRDRAKDGEAMKTLLGEGEEVVVCPEGTTCREPYLLRFSPLFSEVAEVIVPVAVAAKGSMFYGTSVRGHKWLDSFFFLMNPNPDYRLEFLGELEGGCSWKLNECSGISSSYEIANYVQRLIGDALGFECTNFTRRDKYRMLAGNDGVDSRI